MLEAIRAHFHAIRALWRVSNGRWFVLRDAPDDVVANLATLELRDDDPPEIAQLLAEAKMELALRTQKTRRDIDSAIAAMEADRG